MDTPIVSMSKYILITIMNMCVNPENKKLKKKNCQVINNKLSVYLLHWFFFLIVIQIGVFFWLRLSAKTEFFFSFIYFLYATISLSFFFFWFWMEMGHFFDLLWDMSQKAQQALSNHSIQLDTMPVWVVPCGCFSLLLSLSPSQPFLLLCLSSVEKCFE